MQPTGWNQPDPSAPAWPPPASAGGAPPQGWNSPPPPGWGDHAPTAGRPPTAGPPPPAWGPPPAAGGDWGPPAGDAAEARGVGGTVAAHLVLWIGLLAVAVGLNRALRPLIRTGVSFEVTYTVSAIVSLLPVLVALVLAGRSALLRVLGVAAGVALTGLSVLFVFSPGDLETAWTVRIAAYVFALGTWMVVRRHARLGLLLLVPLAALLLLWFPSWGPAPSVVAFARDHGVESSFLLSLWFYVPLVVTALIGLVSSLLRPRPGRSGDGPGAAVVGGLGGLLLVALLVNQLL